MFQKLLIVLAFMAPAVFAQASVDGEVGVLECAVEPGIAFVVSQKTVNCAFFPVGREVEYYKGSITKLGLDFGITGPALISWLVVAVDDAQIGNGDLAGSYVGGSLDASLGIGGGGNFLVGGSNKSVSLQPWSIQGQVGVNFSWAFSNLKLKKAKLK